MYSSRLAMLAVTLIVGAVTAADARPRGGSFGRGGSRPAATPESPAGATTGSRGPSIMYFGGGRSSSAAPLAVGVAAGAVAGAAAAAASSGPTPAKAAETRVPRDPCASDKVFGQGAGFCAVN